MNDNEGMPDAFIEIVTESRTPDDAARVLAGSAGTRPVTLRANTLKSSRAEVAGALGDAGLSWRGASWYGDAFIIEDVRERALWNLPIYQQGGIYLQSLSSMIPPLVLDPQPGEDICDMCAAPGGKTTQICALADNRALVMACELHAPRADKLEHNLAKLGAQGVNVMRADARRLDDFFSFDRILLDAPCSGSGTVTADNPKARRRLTRSLLDKSRRAQRALLAKALRLMKVGSTLVYSTCSVLPCENEDIVREGIANAPRGARFEVEPIEREGFEELEKLPTTIEGALCLCPTPLYEGFFVVKIRRKA